MNDDKHILPTGSLAATARWLALAAAALTPGASFAGTTADPAELAAAADALAPETAAPSQSPNLLSGVEDGRGAQKARATQLRDIPAPPPPEPGVARFENEGPEFFGPQLPKVERGQLANVTWTPAPPEIPPALDQAVNIVTRNYPSALSARAALRASSSDVRAAKWLRFPSIGANLAYLDSSTSPEPQLTVEAPIWAGGRIDAGIRRAQANEDATSANYTAILEQLALTTSNTYFDIVRLTQNEQLLAESVKVHNQLVETMERRVKQEVSPLADLELARSRAAQIEQQYSLTKSQRATSLRVLAELVADPAFDLGPVPYYDGESDLPNREVLEDQAAAHNPTIRRIRAEADVARADVDTRKAAILPQLNAQYSYSDVFGSRVGVVVRAQSAGGLSQFSEVNSARLRIQSALENVRVTEQQLRRDIAADVILYESSRRRAEISTAASDTASRVSASYMRQFIAGRRSWLDVMNALREAVTAQLGKVDSEAAVMASASRLLIRSGRWRPVFDDYSEGPDKGSSGDKIK